MVFTLHGAKGAETRRGEMDWRIGRDQVVIQIASVTGTVSDDTLSEY